MAQEPRERWWYLSAGVCRSRVTQPESYGVLGLPLLLTLRPVLYEQVFECFPTIWETCATLGDGWKAPAVGYGQNSKESLFLSSWEESLHPWLHSFDGSSHASLPG